MPLYVGYTQKRRRVKLYTAGKTVYLLIKNLGGTYDLQAVVNDTTNLRNYELLWEQLTGEPVVLSSTSTLSTSFQILEKTDKLFRFSLDLGTNQEQSEEITVYFTPTSEFQIYGGVTSIPDRDSQTKANQRFGSGYTLPEHSGEFNPEVVVGSGLGIIISPPSSGLDGSVINTRLYGAPGEWTHNPSQIMYDVPSEDGSIQKFFGVEWGSYLVEVTYDLGTHNPLKYRSTAIYAKPGQVGSAGFEAKAVDDVFSLKPGATASKLLGIQKYISSTKNAESLFELKAGSVKSEFLSVTRYINRMLDSFESSFEIFGSVSPSKITRFERINPSSIGSG
jgi:hypothetical protein